MIALSGGTFSPAPIAIDDASATVTVSAGATYAELFSFLAPTRWAVHNAASLPHISIGGAIATGTHGSGAGNGNLATAVRALELVTADGSLLTVAETDPDFPGAAVHVGALGAVTRVTLALVPTFDVCQSEPASNRASVGDSVKPTP
jgi:xylitol oxidase